MTFAKLLGSITSSDFVFEDPLRLLPIADMMSVSSLSTNEAFFFLASGVGEFIPNRARASNCSNDP